MSVTVMERLGMHYVRNIIHEGERVRPRRDPPFRPFHRVGLKAASSAFPRLAQRHAGASERSPDGRSVDPESDSDPACRPTLLVEGASFTEVTVDEAVALGRTGSPSQAEDGAAVDGEGVGEVVDRDASAVARQQLAELVAGQVAISPPRKSARVNDLVSRLGTPELASHSHLQDRFQTLPRV